MTQKTFKWIYGFIFFGSMFFAIYGLRVNFISNIEITKFSLILFIFVSGLLALPLHILDIKGVAIKQYSLLKQFFVFIIFTCVFSALSPYVIYTYSIPAVYSKFYGFSDEKIITIKSKKEYDGIGIGRYSGSGGCRYNIRPKEFKRVRFCISQEFFHSVIKGERIKITGKASNLGFRVTGFEKL